MVTLEIKVSKVYTSFRVKVELTRKYNALAPSLRGLAKIFDFCLGECPKTERHSLRHGFRRATSLMEGGKGA